MSDEIEKQETPEELQAAITAMQAKYKEALKTEEEEEVETVEYPVANAVLKLNKHQSVPIFNITPAEATLLVAMHHKQAGEMPILNLELKTPVKRDPRKERARLMRKYNGKIIMALFPGNIPTLPKKFRAAMANGLGETLPQERMIDVDIAKQ